jgi:hypothetical protein
MKKITDRFLLGVIAGLGGNISKIAVERLCIKLFGFKETGAKKAAGIFIKNKDLNTVPSRIIGNLADNMIASGLGVTCVYWLTFMGKDHYLIKGAGLGAAEWTAMYGVLSKMGATSIFPTKPKDVLVSFASHLAFGATKMIIAVNLGDERLFNPKGFAKEIKHPQEISIPLINSISSREKDDTQTINQDRV